MKVAQTDFASAVLNPALGVPAGLRDAQGGPAGARFAVYRNNVVRSLTEALETAFPVIRQLVGAEFFTAMAGVFVRAHPPASPMLMVYGAEFPGFLERFPPVAHLAYLADVARLEQARREAYHAADVAAFDPASLMALPPDRQADARLVLAPAARLIRSPWPVLGIWRMNSEADAPRPEQRPEDVLVTRPGFDPILTRLPPGGGAFIGALMSGATLGDALEAATDETPDFRPAAVLGALFSTSALCTIKEDLT